MSIVLRGLMAMLLVAAVASCGSTNLGLEETPTRGVSDRWRGQPGHHPNGHDPSFWNTKDGKGSSSYLANDKAPGQFPKGIGSNEKIDHGKKLPGHGATAH